jgi:hypothetical protein
MARDMFVHAAFLYDLFAVSSVWSLFAVEAALRDRLGVEKTFGRLVGLAASMGLLGEADLNQLRAGADLRNRIIHRSPAVVMTPGMAEMLISTSHRVVVRLYADDQDQSR